MTEARLDWSLPRYWPLLIVVPLAVFLLTNWLQVKWAESFVHLAQPWIVDGHAEGSGRVRSVAAFLLFCSLGVTALVYSALIVSRLSRRTLIAMVLAWLLTLGFGAGAAFALGLGKGGAYFDQALPCASFALLARDAAPAAAGQRSTAPPQAVAKLPAPPRVRASPNNCISRAPKVAGFEIPRGARAGDPIVVLRMMYALSGLLLFAAMPAVIWAAIACLASPKSGSPAERLAAWSSQTMRLNRLLYLTAAFMVSGLLFTSTRLGWTGHSLHPADLGPYLAHVSSVVLYAGVSNSLLIASYYIPVAALLAEQHPTLPVGAEGGEAAVAAIDPYAAFKTAATILSPVLVALIGELVKFGG